MESLGLHELRERLARRAPQRSIEADAPQAAVALVVVPASRGGLELLLIRRAERRGDPWSGHMALPGGRRDASDADLLATARRETFEEVAIELAPERLLGELDDLRPRSAPRRIQVRPFVFGLAERPVVRASHEVAEHLWVTVAELAASAGSSEMLHLGERRRMPSYSVGGQVVWGMTQRILEPFVTMVLR